MICPVPPSTERHQRREQTKKYSTASVGPTRGMFAFTRMLAAFSSVAGGLAAVPVVRGREVPVDGEVAGQAPPEVVEWLNVAEGLEHTLVPVSEVCIGQHEPAVLAQELRYLAEFLVLAGPDILEQAQGGDDIESLVRRT